MTTAGNSVSSPSLPVTIATPSEVIQPHEPNREQIINTAVKFLLNPQIRTTPLEQKQSFLRQKGLTDEEIYIACRKSGAYSHGQQLDGGGLPLPSLSHSSIELTQYNPPLPLWVKIRDVTNLVALLSIGSYSLYALWRRYIAPKLFGTPSREEEKFQKLIKSLTGLNENIFELKDLIQKIHAQQSYSQLQMQSNQNSHANSTSKAKEFEIQELKQELAVIKGLLLSRNQFPSSPGIPSWQMVDKETGAEVERDSREVSPVLHDKSATKEGEGDTEEISLPVTRKHSSSGSRDSIALHSDSSCEVVMIGGKNDSDPDHSDD